MSKIGIFFGSDTGYTETVAELVQERIENYESDVTDMCGAVVEDFAKYDKLILGLSTWYDGQLQSDWDYFFDSLKEIDFSGKTVAIFGLGDQYGYGEYFIDGVGIIGKVVMENGGKIIGTWPSEEYDYEVSKADCDGKTKFLGLAIDEDNEPFKTEERVDNWVKQILEEFEAVPETQPTLDRL